MIRKLLSSIKNKIAERKLSSNPSVRIANTAKVKFWGLSERTPSELIIEDFTICEANVASERSGSKVHIGKNSFIGNSRIVCASSIRIGDDVLISWGCTIIDHHSHSVDYELRKDDVRNWYNGHKDWTNVRISPITIGDKAWIGFNSIILAGVTVGEGAVIGCGSVVTRDVPPYSVVAGNPARLIRANRTDAVSEQQG